MAYEETVENSAQARNEVAQGLSVSQPLVLPVTEPKILERANGNGVEERGGFN
jgi:hypothetical protein